MSTFALWRLFHHTGDTSLTGGASRKHTRPAANTGVLAIVAFACATAIFLTVLGGLHAFIWRASPDHTIACFFEHKRCAPEALAYWERLMQPNTQGNLSYQGEMASYTGTYVVLAIFACLLLLVPFASLSASAARLAASRRDERLATLRLAGATTGQVTRLTALDATMQALTGTIIGIVGYFALMPVIMLIRFQDRRFTFQQLWVGPWAIFATIIGVTILALASALLTLRRVAITPLGVTSRAGQPLPSRWRAVIFVVAMVGAIAVMQNMQLISGALWVMYTVLFGVIIGCFALVNMVGSWAVATRAKRRARHPRNAAVMIGMRRILGNPKRAWRNVSGIALAVFIAGITSVCGMFGTQAATNPGEWSVNGLSVEHPATIFMRDIGTGGTLTLVFAAVLAAVSSGIMQSASVYDQAGEYRQLVLEGTDEGTLKRARFQEILTPLNTVVLISALCSGLLLVPMFANILTSPAVVLSYLGGIALCYALVSVGALAANRMASRLNERGYRADD